ncbi:MAG TPA: hypothetical protein VFM53_06075, partial [Anaeromyxobacteraceae bacterium]|nr:hypothetical protein [Anaeromyxobacteraceae bacterium]
RLAGSALTLAAAGGLLLAAAQAALAPWIAGTLLGAPAVAPLLRMAAPLTVVAAVATAQAGVLTGLEAFRGQAAGGAIRGLATLLLVAPGAALLGAGGAVAGYVVAAAVGALVLARSIRSACAARGIDLRLAPSRADLRELAGLGVPAVAASLALTFAAWASTAILARASLPEAGVLGVARQWQSAVLFLASAVSGLGLPLVASALPSRDPAALRRALGASFAASTGLALVAAVPVALLAPTLLGWSGPGFAAHAGVLVVSCATAVLLAANMVVGQAIWALSAARAGVAFALLRAALLVALSAALAPRGAMGVSLAWLASVAVLTLVQAPWMAWLVRRRVAGWSDR